MTSARYQLVMGSERGLFISPLSFASGRSIHPLHAAADQSGEAYTQAMRAIPEAIDGQPAVADARGLPVGKGFPRRGAVV